ncbi:GMC family oxidoreductase [Pseudonocardia tropica]|uniref:GMC family oxidoreductase n=1 Tax=Pseudonocardia tropica TaxID=681289 RepID=A0ABV1JXC4_9PSEU
MIIDAERDRLDVLPHDAVVVVGAGPAGIAVSRRLGEAGVPVVLLESGPDTVDPRFPVEDGPLDRAETAGSRYRYPTEGRARGIGGAGQTWRGQCLPLDRSDLAVRPWVPGSGWPLDPAELDRHRPAAEAFLDVAGGYDETRWADFAPLRPLNWDPERLRNFLTEYCREVPLGSRDRDRLAASRAVRVVVNATVTRATLVDGRATGVRIAAGGRRVEITGREVVLAAGGIENARLLQLSDPNGVGLGTGRAHTGRHLQDHPIVRTVRIDPVDHRVLRDRYVELRRRGRRVFPKIALTAAAQEREGLLNACAVFEHVYSDSPLDAVHRLRAELTGPGPRTLRPGDLVRGVAAVPALARGLYRQRVRGVPFRGDAPSGVFLQVWVEQAPRADRRVTLGARRDALGLPVARIDWFCADEELHTSRLLTRWVAEDLRAAGVATTRDLPAMTDDDAWRGTVRDGFHPAGTTRMSRDPHDGVVDPELAVHGVSGLSVVGGSVFPTSGFANPTLTIVQLALRLADRLRDRTRPDLEVRGRTRLPDGAR